MNHAHNRPTMRMVTFLLIVAVLSLTSNPSGVVVARPLKGGEVGAGGAPLQPQGTNDDEEDWSGDDGDEAEYYYYEDEEEEFDDDEEWDEEYEAKIEQAISHYASKSHQIMQDAIKEGGAAKAFEIGPDGNIVTASGNGGSIEEELWQVEFAHLALRNELDMLLKTQNDDEEFLKNDPELRKLLDGIEDETYRAEVYDDIREEWETKNSLNPDEWEGWSYWQLHAYFSCARVFAGSRPVYSAESWGEIRDFWHIFAKEDKEDMPIPDGYPERTYQFSIEAFDPPLEPFQTAGKGRGLKSGRDIAKGELVFKATNNTVVFTHGHTWRKFLFAINERNGEDNLDDATTCDVLVWSWVQVLEDGQQAIIADLDNGSLLNEGRDQPGWEPPNVRCGKEGDTICVMDYYATKDIKEGDELLCDYRGFAMLDSWPDMGL